MLYVTFLNKPIGSEQIINVIRDYSIFCYYYLFHRSSIGEFCQTAASPALVTLRVAFSPHCSSPSAPMIAPLKAPLSS